MRDKGRMNQEELSGLSSRLNLPVSALQKLPFHQISSIQKLINHKNYFFKNQNDENIIDYERLTHIMQVEGKFFQSFTLALTHSHSLTHLFTHSSIN